MYEFVANCPLEDVVVAKGKRRQGYPYRFARNYTFPEIRSYALGNSGNKRIRAEF